MDDQISDTQLRVMTRSDWWAWLHAHHASGPGVWLILVQPFSSTALFRFIDANEDALCFGWRYDASERINAEEMALRFVPREAGCCWTKADKRIVEKLIKANCLQLAARSAAERAKVDGSWEHLSRRHNIDVPSDLNVALACDSRAARNFDAFSNTAKKRLLEWITDVESPIRRVRRINEVVRLASRNVRTPPDART